MSLVVTVLLLGLLIILTSYYSICRTLNVAGRAGKTRVSPWPRGPASLPRVPPAEVAAASPADRSLSVVPPVARSYRSVFGSYYFPLSPTAPYYFPLSSTGSYYLPLSPTGSYYLPLSPTAPYYLPLSPTGSYYLPLSPTGSYYLPLSPTGQCSGHTTYRSLLQRHTTYRPLLQGHTCLLYTSPSPRDEESSRMPSSA